MKITDGKVVLIDYTLTDGDGVPIDATTDDGPLAYVHGAGQIVPGLEAALAGRRAGDSFTVDVPPELGYGPPRAENIVVVPAREIEDAASLEVGTQLRTATAAGEATVVVIKIEGDEVTIDANHPLAGAALRFAVTVRAVHDAAGDELDRL